MLKARHFFIHPNKELKSYFSIEEISLTTIFE